jgi:soluble lytic murein transglycosylase-like protein
MEVVSSVSKSRGLIVAAALVGAIPVMSAQADAPAAGKDRSPRGKLELLQRPTERLERSIVVHRERLQRQRERREERREARREAREPELASPESFGVSQATLESIAACESGGDPTAVSADGTYRGKYQFDYGTWASVGGSGDPAAAPEAEQDMRAAMLYSQAGASPWPICGS